MRDGRWQMAAGNPGQRLNGLGGLVDWWGARWSLEGERNNEDNYCLLQPVRSTWDGVSVPSPPAYSLIVFSVQIVLIVPTVIFVSIVF